MNYKEVFDWIKETNYEKEHGIKVLNKRIIFDKGDIQFIAVDKSTGEIGLVILYRVSIKKDAWAVWYPSENQINNISESKKFYEEINLHNSTKWKN